VVKTRWQPNTIVFGRAAILLLDYSKTGPQFDQFPNGSVFQMSGKQVFSVQ
jgi:hypothetical protein